MLNGILIIDKPEGFTSHDVVAKLRGILKERRIGHGGTLDPMATGVLPVFIGRATRAADLAAASDKRYIAGFVTGTVTDTQDTTGTVLERSGDHPEKQEILRALPRFRGTIQQVPPMYSAVKVNGKKLYELARRGAEVDRKPREITVSALELLAYDEKTGEGVLDITSSKGTYIRTFCHDLGKALGCGAAMSSLRRVRAGLFDLTDAISLSEVETAAQKDGLQAILRPVDGLFSGYDAVTVGPAGEKACRNGAPVRIGGSPCRPGLVRVYGPDGSFLMLGRAERQDDNTVIFTVKNFFQP